MKLLKVPLFLLIVIIFLALVGIGGVVLVAIVNSPTGTVPEEGVLFQVRKGESSEHVFLRLERENIVRSSLLIRVIAKLYGTETSLKSGNYRIKPDQTTLDVHALLVSGKQEMKRLTVKEGWTLSRIAQELATERLLQRADFLAAARSPSLLARYHIPGTSVEGFLYPETYYFSQDVSAEAVIGEMVDTFYRKLAEILPDYRSLAPADFYRKVIIASIVEREYRKDDEAPVIASVFYNRLSAGQKLESCATVAYVMTDIQGKKHPERLTFADLEIKSPYNTYLAAGLPPGPIGNPGAIALVSSFFPMETNYRYFVLKDPATGVHEFSENFEKHLAAKGLYIKNY